MKYKYLIIGLLLDVFDWLIVGALPIIGDVVDFLGSFYWYTKLGPIGFAGLVELIPGGVTDMLPTNIVLGYLADKHGGKKSGS